MKSKSDWKHSPWTVTIVGTFLGFVLPLATDYIKGIPVFSTIRSIGSFLWRNTIWLLNLDLKLWWVLVAFVLSKTIVYVIRKIARNGATLPSFIGYKEDALKAWKWSWNYKFSRQSKQWEIVDLIPYCPRCSTQLLENRNALYFWYSCPRCAFQATNSSYSYNNEFESPDDILALIVDNIERDNYKT